MIDGKKFSAELLDEYLNKHPKLKKKDSILGVVAKISAEMVTLALEKYDQERPR